MPAALSTPAAFIDHWQKAEANERANSQSVLEKLRQQSGPHSPLCGPPSAALTAKERDIHDRGLVSILQQLHDDLDAAVFAAYAPPTSPPNSPAPNTTTSRRFWRAS